MMSGMMAAPENTIKVRAASPTRVEGTAEVERQLAEAVADDRPFAPQREPFGVGPAGAGVRQFAVGEAERRG